MICRPSTGELDFGIVELRLDADRAEVVAIKIDVENAHRNGAFFESFDLRSQALGKRHAAAANADKSQFIEVFRLFQDFVSEPDQRAVDLGCAHELGFNLSEGHRRDCSAWFQRDSAAITRLTHAGSSGDRHSTTASRVLKTIRGSSPALSYSQASFARRSAEGRFSRLRSYRRLISSSGTSWPPCENRSRTR